MAYIKNNKKSAFSLIELSIVLIIIGLLVAGIVGGKSLIDSAKYRGLANEFEGWRKAVFAFKAATGRLPGDLNDDGYMGWCWGRGCPNITSTTGYGTSEVYDIGSFSAPYDQVAISYCAAPFVDMYLEKISDFKPAADTASALGKNTPFSKIFKKTSFYCFFSVGDWFAVSDKYNTNVQSGTVLLGFNGLFEADNKVLVRPAKYIDEKTDDGIYNSGSVRGNCGVKLPVVKTTGTVTYDEALADPENGFCSIFYRVY